MTKRCYFIGLLALPLLFSSCLSLKIVLHLPQKPSQVGTLQMQYKLSESLQNISNYPAPRDDIAPMPLPLWEWDFRGIAAQSDTIQLQDYSFRPARKPGQTAVIQATLSFATEGDLQLLLGKEIQWNDHDGLSWQLSANASERPDLSYPQLDQSLDSEETQLFEQIFADQSLEIVVEGRKNIQQKISMADFISGKQDIDISTVAN